MKRIAIEEHFLTPAIQSAWKASPIGQEGTDGFDGGAMAARLLELGHERIACMDEGGIDVQVLSVTTPALHNLEPETSVHLARATNDLLAGAIARHPSRFQGFATLPTAAPLEAAAELERAVRTHGFVGAMLCGRTRDRNMDHPSYLPLYQMAATLRVPLSIHPQIPQRAVREVYYSGLGHAEVDMALATFGLGWHYEAGIQFVRMLLAGIFDKVPELQVILGHWGEVILFYLDRLSAPARVAKLQRPVAEYVRNNVYITPSGMWNQAYLQQAKQLVGPDRLLFSTDYPYQYKPGGAARAFLQKAALSPDEKELFAHGNWERLTAQILR